MSDYTFTPHPRPVTDIDRILRFKPAGDPPKPPHNMPLWWDIATYFRDLFTEVHVHSNCARFSAEHFIEDLQAFHDVQYTDEQITWLCHMLQVEYKRDTEGRYCFFYTDFFPVESEVPA